MILSVTTDYFVEIHEKISTSGANKSLVIHKTSQKTRNNIILWCIWVKSHAGQITPK